MAIQQTRCSPAESTPISSSRHLDASSPPGHGSSEGFHSSSSASARAAFLPALLLSARGFNPFFFICRFLVSSINLVSSDSSNAGASPSESAESASSVSGSGANGSVGETGSVADQGETGTALDQPPCSVIVPLPQEDSLFLAEDGAPMKNLAT